MTSSAASSAATGAGICTCSFLTSLDRPQTRNATTAPMQTRAAITKTAMNHAVELEEELQLDCAQVVPVHATFTVASRQVLVNTVPPDPELVHEYLFVAAIVKLESAVVQAASE